MSLSRPIWKWAAAGVLLIVALFASLVVWTENRASDGEWSTALTLRGARDEWVKTGSGDPTQALKFVGWSPSGTSYVYTASQTIDGHTYQGLFAVREDLLPGRTFVVTRDGEVLMLEDSGAVKLIENSGRVRLLKP